VNLAALPSFGLDQRVIVPTGLDNDLIFFQVRNDGLGASRDRNRKGE
jgi:hypothetical protein